MAATGASPVAWKAGHGRIAAPCVNGALPGMKHAYHSDGKPMMTNAQARQILGVPSSCDRAAIEAAFRRRARHSHPDHGGSVERFRQVVEARQALSAPSSPPLIVIHQPPWWRLILAALSARLRMQRAATPRVH